MEFSQNLAKSIVESLEDLDSDIVKWITTLTKDDYVKMFRSYYYDTKSILNKQILGQIKFEEEKLRLELLKNKNKKLEDGEQLNDDEQTKSVSQYPSVIGKKGEDSFELLCKKLSNQYNIISTAKIGKQGDFIIEYSNKGMLYKCLVDIKNYEKTVPKKEIEKFYEDLNYGSYNAGLILSKKSKFTGISESIYIKETFSSSSQDTIPVMYLSSLTNELIIKCIEILFFKITVIKEKKFDYMQIENILININNALEHSSLTRRILKDHQDATMTAITKSLNNLNSLEQKINDSINYINKVIYTTTSCEAPNCKVPKCETPADKLLNDKLLNDKLLNDKLHHELPNAVTYEAPTKDNLKNLNLLSVDANADANADDTLSIISYETTNSVRTSSTSTTIEKEASGAHAQNALNAASASNESNAASVPNAASTASAASASGKVHKMKKKIDEMVKKYKNIKTLPIAEQNKIYNKHLPKYKSSDIKKLNSLFIHKWDIILNNEVSFVFVKENVVLFIDPFKTKSVVYLEFIDEENLTNKNISLKTHFKIGKSNKLKADLSSRLLNEISFI